MASGDAGGTLRALRATLILGAAYDLAFAAAMVFAPGLPARLLGLPQPGERFYLWVLAILLAMLAAAYLAAWSDPLRYRALVWIAIVGRLCAGAAFIACALPRPDLAGLYALAAGDSLIAVAHLATSAPLRA